MKRMIATLAIVAGLAGVRAVADERQALADWNALEQSADALKTMMADTVAVHAPNVIGDDEKALAVLAEYEANLRPRVTRQLAEFAKTYGGPEAMDARLSGLVEIDWRGGKHPTTPASQLYQALARSVDNIAQARVNRADALVREAKDLHEQINRTPARVTDENFAKLKEALTRAVAFHPGHAEARDWLPKVEAQRREAMAAVEKRIDGAKWPGHAAAFAGPGAPDKLAKAALAWMQNDERQAGRRDRTFAVAVRGDWVSAQKNLLGQTIQWGLPIWAACCFDEEREQGNCRVFSLTILTAEGGPDIRKAPPWTYTWVGDSYTMRIRNVRGSGVIEGVRAGGGALKAGRGGAPAGAFFRGIVLRLALVAVNLLAGLLAAAEWLRTRSARLDKAWRALTPQRCDIGIAGMAVGLLVLLSDLVRLAPFANLLPAASVLAAGALLARPWIRGRTAGTRVGGLLAGHPAVAGWLEQNQAAIGLACLALGVVHLLFGGIVLI